MRQKFKWVTIAVFTLTASVITPVFLLGGDGLIEAHQQATTSCLDCHTLLKGVQDSHCLNCHEPDLLSASPFHSAHSPSNCISCHTEHHGLTSDITTPFKHESLGEDRLKRCEQCHTTPDSTSHPKTESSCSSCHQWSDWTPKEIDHSKLPRDSVCLDCHKRPDDELHGPIAGDQCSRCHQTSGWSPADFDHANYFRFDRHHQSACSTCHVNKRWSEYTCYGCHEHTQRSVQREHREEGVRASSDCVQCHRSGDDDEAKWGSYGKSKKNDWGSKNKGGSF